MLGMGERADVGAHATGTGFGVLFGALLGLGVKRPMRNLGQALALSCAVAMLVGAWLLAFRHA